MEPVATDQVTPPPPDKIIPEAYGMLAMVFFALLAMTLFSVFSQKGERAKPNLATELANSRLLLAQEALISVERTQGGVGSGLLRKQTDESYQTVIDSIEKKASAPGAKRLLVGLYAASGRKVPTAYIDESPTQVPPEVIELLVNKSKDPKDIDAVANWHPTSTSDRFWRIGALRCAGAENRYGNIVNVGAALGLGVLMGIGGLLAVVGVVILIAVLTDRAKFVSKLRGFACGPLSNVMASELAARASVFLVLYVASSIPFQYLSIEKWPEGASTTARGLTILVVALFSAAVPIFGRRGLTRIWGKVSTSEGFQVGLGGLAANVPVLLATLPFILVLSKFLPDASHPITNELSRGTGVMESLAILFVGSICAPIAEETVFRGMLFPALSKVFKSPIWGGLAQAFMFASIHPQGPAAWVSLMAIGAVCAAVTYRAGAQWPSMLLHGLHNGILLLLNIALTNL
jgi:membrane protease YdiL (CAAX protease family)